MFSFLFTTLWGKIITTFFISMVPVIELRGAIPYATGMGLSPWIAIPVAMIGNLLPIPFIIIFIISMFVDAFKKNEYVNFAFLGIKAAVAFLILKTGVNMFIKMKKKPYQIIAFSIVFVSMLLFELFAVSFSAVYFILLGGIAGIVIYAILNIGEKENGK